MSICLGGGPPAGVGAAGGLQEKGLSGRVRGSDRPSEKGGGASQLWPPGRPVRLKSREEKRPPGPPITYSGQPLCSVPSVLSTG